nr:MAG TPA: hypothetical protein [Caudoviricetes sp.]
MACWYWEPFSRHADLTLRVTSGILKVSTKEVKKCTRH